jgi:hypothetical protein
MKLNRIMRRAVYHALRAPWRAQLADKAPNPNTSNNPIDAEN